MVSGSVDGGDFLDGHGLTGVHFDRDITCEIAAAFNERHFCFDLLVFSIGPNACCGRNLDSRLIGAHVHEHAVVVETGVIGKPDETAGSIIKAFVVLVDGVEPSAELERELLGHGRKRLGAAVAPREVEIVDRLPHTRSGKIMRRVLSARELGEDAGDTSTLETEPTDRPTGTSRQREGRTS